MAETKRLYDAFQPEHYDIFLDISRENKTINGNVQIQGHACTPTFELNQKFMHINSVKVNDKVVDFTFSDKAEAVTINGKESGDISVFVEFSTELTDPMMGIYPSYYQIDGVKKQIVSTQFETTFARQAFPCVDEPLAKATFSLAIKYDEQPGETVIANQPEEKCVDGVHYFQETVRMSTYLIAFAFGDLQKKITHTKSGVEIGVFATKSHAPKELDFGLDIAKRCIEFYEDFYQTPYPLAQSYQLACPDFSAGAMENWGLVTYREGYLLLDPDNTTLSNKQLVAGVIAHELAHQWFGDLVTMKWWDNLWLNESFANMMEYVAVDALEPSWHAWENFHTSDVAAALRRDATDGVQSVHVMVNDPAEIDAIFDSAIVYAKGARLLVMVRALLGDEALCKGLKAYFAKHQYANAEGHDLWSALEEASSFEVGKIMDSWLEQPGYPVVEAKVENGQLVLSQEQFFIGEHKDAQRLWQIPIHCNYAEVPALMTTKTLNLGDYQALRAKNGKAFQLNIGNVSHFIVKYDATLQADLIKELANLDAISQLQVLQDNLLLAQSSSQPYANLIPLMEKLSNSKSNIVQTKLAQVTSNLMDFVTVDSAEEKALKAFIHKLTANSIERLGVMPKANESNDDSLARPVVLNLALYAENEQVIKALHEIYQANVNDIYNLPAAIRSAVLRNEMKQFGSKDLFDKFLKAYVETSDTQFRQHLRQALSASQDVEQLKKLISKFKQADVIKPQDVCSWYYGVLANHKAQDLAFEWMKAEWPWLNKALGGDMSFSYFITATSNIFHTEAELKAFNDFFMPKLHEPGLEREIIMDSRAISSKVEMIKLNKESVLAALQ